MTLATIPLFRPRYRVDECLQELRGSLESGWTGVGPKCSEFEEAWKRAIGHAHACFVSSATAGLHLAVRVLRNEYGWQKPCGIVTTPLTFVSTNAAIVYEGLTPVFADVDEYLCLDRDTVEEAIRTADVSVVAVMFVGYAGSTGKLHGVAELCRERGLKLIVDAAHMAGTRSHLWNKNDADATVYSFHAVKNVPIADGGMVCVRESNLDQAVRRLSWMGIDRSTFDRTKGNAYAWAYWIEELGFKYHGNDVLASIGLVGLRHLEEDNAKRRNLSNHYDFWLKDVRVPNPSDCTQSAHLYPVLVPQRDQVSEHLQKNGIQTGVHYRLNTEYKPFREFVVKGLPKAESAASRLLSLPMHTYLTEEDVERVSKTLWEVW